MEEHIKIKMVMRERSLIVNSSSSGKMEKTRTQKARMIYRSRRRVNKSKKVLINFLYKVGIRVTDIVNLTGISRATVYRHIKR